ncbi:hypothetical protein T09_14647 [Trichinella sp. T9]|nr:hypothetical protein T09_14647 [Trichinella sp. T9]
MANSCDKLTGEFAECPDCSDKKAELAKLPCFKLFKPYGT